MDASERKRNRSMADGADTSGATPPNQKKRCRADDLPLAFVAVKEIVREEVANSVLNISILSSCLLNRCSR